MRDEAEYKGDSGAVSLGARRRRDAEGVSEYHTAVEQRPSSSGDDTLGTRLRAERERSGLTLRELARRLEVSPSLVSQIETGKSQPSVRTLYAIVSELGISLDELFAPADGAPDRVRSALPSTLASEAGPDRYGRVQRADDRDVIDLGSGVHWERLTTWNDRDVEFLYTTYEPGGSSSPDGSLMRHNGREFGVVLTGELGVKVGFEDYVLHSGDSIAFDSSTPHRLHNDGDEVVTAIWIVLGRHPAGAASSDDRPSFSNPCHTRRRPCLSRSPCRVSPTRWRRRR